MASTTVMLANLPQTLEDLLAGVLAGGGPALSVRRGQIAEDGLVAAASRHGADVVVVRCADPMRLEVVDQRLAAAAAITVLALSPQADWACLHRLERSALRLDDISAAQFVTAVTRAARGAG